MEGDWKYVLNHKSRVKNMHHENFLWKSLQEEMEIFRDRYPHINRHAIYSQNYNEVLPSLQESVNPYPSQWFQTTGKMYTQNVCFGYSFLLNKFPQIIVIYYLSGFSMLIWFSWVIFFPTWCLSLRLTVIWRCHLAGTSKKGYSHGWLVLIIFWGCSMGTVKLTVSYLRVSWFSK